MLVALFLLITPQAFAAKPKPKVVLIVADRLVAEDLFGQKDPKTGCMQRLANGFPALSEGELQVGLIGPNVAGRRNPNSMYASVSAGCASRGGDFIGDAYSSDEPVEGAAAAVVYHRRTGLKAPLGSVVHLQTGPVFHANEKLYNPTQVGYLGEKLKRAGVKVAVFGNSDLAGMPYRPAVVLAMDLNGLVPHGDVSARCLRSDPDSPAGIATDVPKLTRMVRNALVFSDFVVVDFGDTARLEAMRPLLSPDAYDRYLGRTLDSLWRFVVNIREKVPQVDEIYLVSLSPRLSDKGEWDRLAPILISKGGCIGVRPIYSDTTRTTGLVSAIDLGPAILQSYGIASADMIGRPFRAAKADPGRTIAELDRQATLNEHAQTPVLAAFAGIGAVVITIATVIVAFSVTCSPFVLGITRFIILILASAPLGMLWAAGLRSDNAGQAAVAVAVCVLGVASGSRAVGWLLSRTDLRSAGDLSLAVALLATALSLIIAGLTGLGGSSLKFSLMGGFSMSGMRYYGIGNEYMGVLVGGLLVAALWFTKALAGRKGESFTIAAFNMLFVLAILALSPTFGANTGGVVTAIVTFGLAYIATSGRKFGWRQPVLLLALGALLAATLGLLDFASRGWGASHLGRAMAAASGGQGLYIMALFGRKMLLNFKLLGTRQASTALLAFSPFFVLWLFGAQRRVDDYLAEWLRLRWGLAAGLVGAGVAFLTNDSGVVSAFLMLACVVEALLYSCLVSRVEC